MNAFLDIGFTLLGGPELSPPKMIAKIIGADEGRIVELSEIVFARNHPDPESLTDSLEKLFRRSIGSEEKARIVDFWNSQYEEVYALDWACEFVSGLIEAGLRVHVVSNLWFPFYDKFCRIFEGDRPFFASETLSFKEGVKKPNPEFYRIAMERSSADPARSFSVGDSLGNDILPYAEMGMKCVWFVSRPLVAEKAAYAEKILAGRKNIFKVENLKEAFEIVSREKKSTIEELGT